MDPVLEKVRDLAIQEIDRRSDIARVIQSGRWPVLIIKAWPWLPQKVVSGRLRFDQDQIFNRSRSLTAAAERNRYHDKIDTLRELSTRDRLYSIEYSLEAGSPRRFWILVDPDQERVHFNHLFEAIIAKPLLLEKIKPEAEEQHRWDEVKNACAQEHAALKAAREKAEGVRQEWAVKRFPALAEIMRSEGMACLHCRRRSNDFLVRPPTMICRACGGSHWPEDVPGESPPPVPEAVPFPFVSF